MGRRDSIVRTLKVLELNTHAVGMENSSRGTRYCCELSV